MQRNRTSSSILIYTSIHVQTSETAHTRCLLLLLLLLFVFSFRQRNFSCFCSKRCALAGACRHLHGPQYKAAKLKWRKHYHSIAHKHTFTTLQNTIFGEIWKILCMQFGNSIGNGISFEIDNIRTDWQTGLFMNFFGKNDVVSDCWANFLKLIENAVRQRCYACVPFRSVRGTVDWHRTKYTL